MNSQPPFLGPPPYRRRLAIALAGGLLAFATGGCESLVNSGLNPRGHAEVRFPPGVSHEALRLPGAGGRVLVGSLVRASAPRGPLLLIFHGDGEAVGDWSGAQTFLAGEVSARWSLITPATATAQDGRPWNICARMP